MWTVASKGLSASVEAQVFKGRLSSSIRDLFNPETDKQVPSSISDNTTLDSIIFTTFRQHESKSSLQVASKILRALTKPLQFSAIFLSLLSATPFVVQGIAVPSEKFDTVQPIELFPDDGTPVARADDEEWLMVLWSKPDGEAQCGGTYTQDNGVGSACKSLIGTGAWCVDLAVRTGVCDFKFKADGKSCSGEVKKEVTVEAQKDSNGIPLDADFKFVSIECSE